MERGEWRRYPELLRAREKIFALLSGSLEQVRNLSPALFLAPLTLQAATACLASSGTPWGGPPARPSPCSLSDAKIVARARALVNQITAMRSHLPADSDAPEATLAECSESEFRKVWSFAHEPDLRHILGDPLERLESLAPRAEQAATQQDQPHSHRI
jgi:hypothetical protein